MKIKAQKEKEYEEYVNLNSGDVYSLGVVNFAKRWAELMEEKIENGAKVADIASITSQKADTEGITGYMYSCAVGALSYFWEYGEDLRKWHNNEYAYDGEGVVNTAILTLK